MITIVKNSKNEITPEFKCDFQFEKGCDGFPSLYLVKIDSREILDTNTIICKRCFNYLTSQISTMKEFFYD
jgi:hypothetical protein